MKCMDPKLCYTAINGSRQLRHFSQANDLFKQRAQSVFDCGTCYFCRKKRALELASRCVLHSSLYKENAFLTLTYDEKRTTYHNNFEYSDVQTFKKLMRQHVWRKYKKRIEIFNVHEYGKNGKKHWHLICFGHNFATETDRDGKPIERSIQSIKSGNKLFTSPVLSRLWTLGFATIGDVSEASALYTAQYAQKDTKNGNLTNGKKSHSHHSGIGKPYFIRHYKQILGLGYVPLNENKMPVPRSWLRHADKHWCHFYDQSAFYKQKGQKEPKHTPFTLRNGPPRKALADLYYQYKLNKQEYVAELEKEWNTTVQKFIDTHETPDFRKSADNALYDLKNKTQIEQF